MSKALRRLVSVLFIMFIIFAITAGPVINRGYRMYIDAVSETSVSEKMNEIKESAGYTDIQKVPDFFTEELLRQEDVRFNSHNGIDIKSIIRAVFINLKDKNYTQGGSTITQQLAKNMYFTFEKDMARKVAEVFVVRRIEDEFSKDEILSRYCSIVFFGENCYGLKEACRHYYGIRPEDMSEEQALQLVRTLKAPSVYNPSNMTD